MKDIFYEQLRKLWGSYSFVTRDDMKHFTETINDDEHTVVSILTERKGRHEIHVYVYPRLA